MSTSIDFYFDFLSPYAYYARHRLVQIATQHGARINYLPTDLKRLKLDAGNTGPATVQMPRKLAYALTDFERWARRYGITAAVSPACFDVRALQLGVFHAAEQGRAEAYVKAGLEAVWAGGGASQDSVQLFEQVVARAGLGLADVRDAVAADAAVLAFEATHETAVARGVFGVPTVLIGGELWWGNDRLDMVEEHLASLAS